ncbi:MAG TPA: IclR family transcriptional regulator [Actinoallomurus sp.]|nr:IclR family transcriptional regulator [Actinoallomurus sp.]
MSNSAPVRGAESARRVLAVLMAFTKERHTLSARDLAEATEIPLPSVYRYVAFLRDTGLLVGADQGGYYLSARLLQLAQAAEAAETLVDIADPVMRRLAAETRETVILVRLVGRSAVCVHRVESSHRLRTSYEPGQPMSLEHGASARILLASMSPEARRAYLEPLAARDPEAAARLEEEVVLVEQRGWECSEEEIDRGIWAAAAAVRDSTGILASLSVPSPLVRAPAEMHDRLLGQVRAAADEINELLRAAHR